MRLHFSLINPLNNLYPRSKWSQSINRARVWLTLKDLMWGRISRFDCAHVQRSSHFCRRKQNEFDADICIVINRRLISARESFSAVKSKYCATTILISYTMFPALVSGTEAGAFASFLSLTTSSRCARVCTTWHQLSLLTSTTLGSF